MLDIQKTNIETTVETWWWKQLWMLLINKKN